MALDTELVCPDCRRFWHGAPGWLPFPSPQGVYCTNPRHALPSPGRKPLPLTGWGEIVLDPDDMEWAEVVGQTRQQRREAAGHKNAHASMDAGEDHILGAMGECAYSRLSGRPWTGALLDIGGDNDVDGVQVRTRREHHYDLYLWPDDKRDAWWVLMTGHGPTFVCQGRIWGAAACDERYFTPANPSRFPRAACYVIPQKRLEKELA